ncbi:MAG: hypothetical protein ACK5LC_08010, partial [Coprobacillaceae bacterium]
MVEFLYKNREFILFVPASVVIRSSNWRFKKEVIKLTKDIVEMEQGKAYIIDISNYLLLEVFISKLEVVINKSLKDVELYINPSVFEYIDSRQLHL